MGRAFTDWRSERIEDLMEEMSVIRDRLLATTNPAEAMRLCTDYAAHRAECQSLEQQQAAMNRKKPPQRVGTCAASSNTRRTA